MRAYAAPAPEALLVIASNAAHFIAKRHSGFRPQSSSVPAFFVTLLRSVYFLLAPLTWRARGCGYHYRDFDASSSGGAIMAQFPVHRDVAEALHFVCFFRSHFAWTKFVL